MALIGCKECNKEISDTAVACPHCGAPVRIASTKKSSNRSLKKWIIFGVIAVAILTIFFNMRATGGGDVEVEKTRKPIDYSLPVYTTDRAMVCPYSVLFDKRSGMGMEAIKAAYTTVFGRSEAIKKVGCEEWQKGHKIILTVGQGDRSDKMFAFFDELQSYAVIASDLTNNEQGDIEYTTIISVESSNSPLVRTQQTPNAEPIIETTSISETTLIKEQTNRKDGSDSIENGKSISIITLRPTWCAKASTLVEKIICNDDDLSKLDIELADIFSRAKITAVDKQTFSEQSNARWKQREAECKDKECIFSWYTLRRGELQAELDANH